ncbi:MAG: DUF3347 domain-containing protein [Balneolaceae bacterium]|nr:DUF3347 domain-containing protein [Balneolaceae bacterium]
MKTLTLSAIILFVLSTFSFAQDSTHQHTEHLDAMVSSYLEIKNALVNDDFEQAQSALQAFADEVINSKEMNHHPEHSEMHKTHHNKMTSAINSALESENISQLRNSFDDISDHLTTALKNQGYKEELYVQYCPMADNGNGAKWISKNEKIENPYYGAKMHSCGETMKAL